MRADCALVLPAGRPATAGPHPCANATKRRSGPQLPPNSKRDGTVGGSHIAEGVRFLLEKAHE
jgi:hypothetical protein